MGFEFEGRAAAPLSNATITQVFALLATDPGWKVVRQEAQELALRPAAETGGETVVIEIDGPRIYVLFHAATQQQRDGFLAVLKEVLVMQRVRCTFAEV